MTDEEKRRIQEEIGWRKIVIQDLKSNRKLIEHNQTAIAFLLFMMPISWGMIALGMKIWG